MKFICLHIYPAAKPILINVDHISTFRTTGDHTEVTTICKDNGFLRVLESSVDIIKMIESDERRVL